MNAYKIKKLTADQRKVLQFMAGNGGSLIQNHTIAICCGFHSISAGKDDVRKALVRCSTVCRQLIAKGLLERGGWIGEYRTTFDGEFDAGAYADALLAAQQQKGGE